MKTYIAVHGRRLENVRKTPLICWDPAENRATNVLLHKVIAKNLSWLHMLLFFPEMQ